MDTTSYWQESTPLPEFPALERDTPADVVVVGAGITGLTAAYLFKKAGHSVVVLERGRVGGFDTSNTTAHLTCVTDSSLSELARTFGKDRARLAWEGGRAAIDQIFKIAQDERIACDFKWVPGYWHAPLARGGKEANDKFRDEAQLASQLGFPAEFLERVPFVGRPGVKFLHQAKFHPRKYLAGLLKALSGTKCRIFENTAVEEVLARPLQVKAGPHKVRCSFVFLATHTPLTGKTALMTATLFQTKLYLYTTYALSAKIPSSLAPEASFWDTSDPYYYLRIDRAKGFDRAILGGEDHKTGQTAKTKDPYKKLEKAMLALFPAARLEAQWSGQVIETPDGLPYIGETASRQFAATGFSGNGMTYGTLGAMMAVDAFHKRKNPWADLFDVNRKKIIGSALDYLSENKDYPYYYLRDRLARAEGKSLRGLARNEGRILQLNGHKVAAYRNAHGKVSLCSPICTHLQCIVAWNPAEKTWDCPCHGSRFAPTGEVLSGPAETPLEKIEEQKD